MKLTAQEQDAIRVAHGPLWLELAVLCAEETGGTRLFYLDTYMRVTTLPDVRHLNWDQTTLTRRFAALETVPVGGGDMVPEPIWVAVLVSYGDYSSATDHDAANYRWLLHRWSENVSDPLLLGVGHTESDGLGLAVRIGDSRWSEEDLTELISIIKGLVDSPMISEETHAEYESEKREEWWESYRRILLDEVDDVMAADSQPLNAEGEPYTWETAPLDAEYTDDPRDREDLIRAELYERVDEWVWEGSRFIRPVYTEQTVPNLVDALFDRPNHTRHELITVEWDSASRTYHVSARASVADGWSSFEGPEGDVDELLSLARDVMTGG